jgi:alpha-tubulin suppressor-like RCC1 family protein
MRVSLLVLAACATSTVVACSGDTTSPDPGGNPPGGAAAIRAVAGQAQTAEVGTRVAQDLEVVVIDADEQPVAGVRVQWQPASGSGSVSNSATNTDAQGRAFTTWTLGTGAGAQRVTASAGSLAVDFTATATPAPAVAFVNVPDSIGLEPGMDSVLRISGRDQYGNPTAAAPVWTSDNTAVARVDASGAVVAVAPGRTLLTGRYGALTARVTLIVGFRYRQVAVGYDHTCAVTGAGRVHCWGLTFDMQAGAPVTGETCGAGTPCLRAPRIVTNDIAFATVSPGSRHTCAIGSTQRLHCWGSNFSRALGTANADWGFRTGQPVEVDATRAFVAISADDQFACALDSEGAAYCWGRPGPLGNPGTAAVGQPAAVGTAERFASITTGAGIACGLTAAGVAHCWGDVNGNGQVGAGDREPHYSPVQVVTTLRFRLLVAGGAHVCAIALDNRTYCWGSNSHGQLGIAGAADALTPAAVQTGETFTSLAAGGTHTCGLTAAGNAWCWGSNYDGQLGNGNFGSGPQPRAVAGGLRFTALAAHRDVMCGLATDQRLHCWGDNDYGQVGDGTTTDAVAPVRVLGQM